MASTTKKTTENTGTKKQSVIDPLYQKFTKSVVRALGSTEFYEFFMDAISKADNQFQFSNRKMEKTVDTSWVDAIEASLPLPEEQRQIRVYMDMKGTQLYISFTNFTASKKMEKVGKVFKTSKGDGHGFGLVRIDAIIERLDGYLSRNSEDGAFTTEILIPQV